MAPRVGAPRRARASEEQEDRYYSQCVWRHRRPAFAGFVARRAALCPCPFGVACTRQGASLSGLAALYMCIYVYIYINIYL
eukprot:2329222-Pyramimonas_sp.AAC.1